MSWTRKIIEQGKASGVEVARRLDSWANALTGIGTWRDKTAHMLPQRVEPMSPLELETLYHTDDISTRIVRAVVDEAFREPWRVLRALEDGETDEMQPVDSAEREALETEMRRFNAWHKLKEGWIWGRLYGKGALWLGANDGLPANEPLDESRVTSFDFLTVLDRRDMTPKSWYADPEGEKFGEIAEYWVQPLGVYMGQPYGDYGTNPPIVVHESRLVLFRGELTNKRLRLANQGCDYSVLQKCFRALQLTNNNWQSASTLLADAGQGVFKIRGLIDMIAQNPDVMTSRMQLVDMMRSTIRAVILDAGDERSKTPPEDFTRIATPFTGVPEMLRETWNRLACAAEMPLWKLMGSAPGSLQGSEEEGQEDWYNQVEGAQHFIAKPAAERILGLMAKGLGIGGQWTAEPFPLRRMSPAQSAKADLDRANAAKAWTDSGVYMPEEIALSRQKDPSGQQMFIDTKARKQLLKASFSAAEAEKKMAQKELAAPVAKPGAPAKAPKKT